MRLCFRISLTLYLFSVSSSILILVAILAFLGVGSSNEI
jgi:hypothetical protein